MSKRDDDSQADMEVGMTTAERRRRRRRGGGLRVPSDNVPRRASTPPVVAPVPEDPALAMSIAYSFNPESSEPVPRTTTRDTAVPSFEGHEGMPTVIDPVSGPIEQSDFEMKTREMTAVDLEALGLSEISSTSLPVQRLSSPGVDQRSDPSVAMSPEAGGVTVRFRKRQSTDPVDDVDVEIDNSSDGDGPEGSGFEAIDAIGRIGGFDAAGSFGDGFADGGPTLNQVEAVEDVGDDLGDDNAADVPEVDSAEFSTIDPSDDPAAEYSQLRPPIVDIAPSRPAVSPAAPPAIPYRSARAQTVALSEDDLEEVREAARLATQPPIRPVSMSIPPPMPPGPPGRAPEARPRSTTPSSVPEIDLAALEDRASEPSTDFEVDVDGIVDARPQTAPMVPVPAAEPRSRQPSNPPPHGPPPPNPPPLHSHPPSNPPPMPAPSGPPSLPVRDSQPLPITRDSAHSSQPLLVRDPRDAPPPPLPVRDPPPPLLPSREPPPPPPAAREPAPTAREAPHAPPPPPPPASHKAPPAPPPSKRDKVPPAPIATPMGRADGKPPRGKPWFIDLFDEDYLRTLPFLTPQATQAEAEFVIDAMGLTPGASVLDVGCGYGRHAMELAARGFHVVGLDISTPLLVRGGEEAHRRGLTINFIRGDMREIDFEAQFDGAYCLFSTFGYFDDETNKKTVANIARALRPGGRILIEILNRDYVIADLPTRVWWEGDGCVVLEEVELNYFSSRIQVNRSVVFDDGRQLEQEISVRAYSLHEVGKFLHATGFRVLEVSGAYHTRGRFFGNQSRHIIVLAERKDPGAT